MKVKELVAKLNKAVKDFDLKGIKNHNQFHAQLAVFLSPILPERFTTKTWTIYYIYRRKNENWITQKEIIKYEDDFTKDKRCKWEDRGTFSSVRFMAEKKMDNIDIEKMEKYLLNEDKKQSINYYKGQVLKLKKELNEAKNKLIELRG